MLLRCLLFCTILIAATTASADKKDKKKGDTVAPTYALPEPDALPRVPLPERSTEPVTEIRAIIRHTVAQQQGIDVSHYQGHINWEEVAQDKTISFVYVKATEGASLVDDCYVWSCGW